MIHKGCIIGENVLFGEFVVIGGAPEHREQYREVSVTGNVIIGDGCVINNHVTIDSGIERPTVIGNDCFIMAKSHIGHDAILEDGVTLSPGSVIGGHAEIGKGTTIGINASIHQRVKVPEGCMIGMGSVITKTAKLLPYRKYVGVGRDLGDNTKAIEQACLTSEEVAVIRLKWINQIQ